jgi:uncharacterized protein (DUF3084 family)
MRKLLFVGLLLVCLSLSASYGEWSQVEPVLREVLQALETTQAELQTVSTELQAARNEQEVITSELLTLRDERLPALTEQLVALEDYYAKELRRITTQMYVIGSVALLLTLAGAIF